jgi:D-alanyl-D-alanine carboxypeptidase (penicillin-binding protein 5/6)
MQDWTPMSLRPTRTVALPLLAAALALFCAAPAPAQDIETAAEFAYMVDFDTGAVLLAKNEDAQMAPASMSKMMTVYMLFEQLKEGSVALDDTFAVSEKAWRMGGSKMFVEVDKRVRVEDLIRGIVVQSGNDAAIVVAEGLAGDEAAFAERMTEKARSIGMEDSHFANATGWPHPEHYTTAHDLVMLATHTIRDFPDYYHYYSEVNFTFNGIKQGNRNPLLYRETGGDGLKTGHTEESGYGLTASAVRGDRRLVLTVNGLSSVRERSQESERLLDWGFREFANVPLFTDGETVTEADVWLGDAATVPLRVDGDLTITLRRASRKKMKVSAVFDNPIPAPLAAGDQVGVLKIEAPEFETREVPLLAGATVERLGLVGRLSSAVSYLIWGGSAQ